MFSIILFCFIYQRRAPKNVCFGCLRLDFVCSSNFTIVLLYFVLTVLLCVVFFLGSALIFFCLVRFIVLQILLRLSKVMRVREWGVCVFYVCLGERQCGLF